MDDKWEDVMKVAKKYGFIVSAYAGTAILATHKNQIDAYGDEEYKKIQKINKEDE